MKEFCHLEGNSLRIREAQSFFPHFVHLVQAKFSNLLLKDAQWSECRKMMG